MIFGLWKVIFASFPAAPVTNEYTEHSIFVLGVDGETVTYVDCNGHGAPERCIIEWDKTITKTTLQNKGLVHIRIAPYKVR